MTPSGVGGPSLAAHFQYRGGRLMQIAYTGTGVPAHCTDAYLYNGGAAPYALLRTQGGATRKYWYETNRQHL